MNKVFVIAKNTFRETIRDRIVYGIVAFGLLFIGSTVILGTLSLGEDLKVIRDFGLAGLYIFGFTITVFLGASLMHKEIAERTIYLVLSKPVSVFEFLKGKFLGLCMSVAVATGVLAVVYLGVVALKGGGFDYLSLVALGLQLEELAIFVALAIVLSLLYGPLLSVMYSVCLLYMGHSLDLLVKYGVDSNVRVVHWLTIGIFYVFPNLEKFNIRNFVIYGHGVSLTVFVGATVYALCYCGLLLLAAEKIIKHKEL